MLNGTVAGGQQVAGKLKGVAGSTRGAIRKTVGRLTLELLVKVKQEKLSGQALNVRTGRLRRSITQRITSTDSEISAIVGTNVEYGKFHEMGLGIKADMKKKREAFKAGLLASKPSLNPDNLPPRSFLRSALKEMSPRILEEFKNSVRESSTTWRLL